MIDLKQLTFEERSRIESFATDPLVDAVIQAEIAKYIEMWRNSPPDQPDKRETFYRMVQAFEGVRSELRNIAADRRITAFNNKSRV